MRNATTIRFVILLTFTLGLLFYSQAIYAQNNIGWIEVKSTPSSIGADIFIDGTFTATVPAKIKASVGMHTISIQREFYEPMEKTLNVKSGKSTYLSADLRRNAKVINITTQDDAEIWIDGEYMVQGHYTSLISYGKHTLETKLDGCRGYKEDVIISESSANSISLPVPQPILGSLLITSNTPAKVKIDGQDAGKTPLNIDSSIKIGKHSVMIAADDYITEEKIIEINEGECTNLHIELSEVVNVDFRTKPSPSLLSINGEIIGKTPHPTKLKAGEYDVTIYSPKYVPIQKTIKVNSQNKTFDFKLKRQYLKSSAFYISGEYQLLGIDGIKGSIGGFIQNINIEANVVYGLKESETIYWNIPNEMTEPCGYTYKPLFAGARLGYSFIIGTRLRITPQVGSGIVMIKGTKVSDGVSDPKTTDGYCIPGIAGARVDFAIAPSVAICLTPNYSFSLMESKLYSQLSSTSKVIKGYSNGFSVSAGLCFFF